MCPDPNRALAINLTNLATLRDWPRVMTIVDLLWGVVLSTAVTWVSFIAGRWMLP